MKYAEPDRECAAREDEVNHAARKIPALALAAGFVLAAIAPRARAGSLSTSILGLLPKDVGEVAYADMKTARQNAWFAQFEGQVLPSRFRQFEEFVSAAGIDPEKQVDEIVWAASMGSSRAADGQSTTGAAPGDDQTPRPAGEQLVGIALGNFSPDVTEQYFAKQKLPTRKVSGYSLYAFGSGVGPSDIFFFFIDSNTAAFGNRALLERLIAVRFGEEQSLLANETLFPLVDSVNGQGTIWAAMDQGYTRIGMTQLLPEAAQFPGATPLLSRIKAMTVTVQTDHGADTRITPVCGSSDDAVTLASLLQAGLLYKRYQEGQSNPDLARAIDATSVSAEGDHLKIRTQLNEDLLAALLKRNAFAVRM
jgi:hypothetical protein